MWRFACTLLLLASVASAEKAAPTKAQLERQRAALEAKEKAAEERATREVTSGRYRDGDLFKADQQKEAIRSRTRQLFGRTQRRLAKALEDAVDFLDQGQPDAAGVVLRSWTQNRRMSSERQAVRHVRSTIQRLHDDVPGLRRDRQDRPGTPASAPDPSVWRAPPAYSPAELYSGPWTEKDSGLTLPGKDSVLRLTEVRDLDADGMHPSATGVDPATGKELKVKLHDGYDMNAAAILGRLVTAMGYHSPQATYFLPEVKVEPQLIVAAYRHKQRIGVRVREDSPLTRVGVRPGKYGYSPFGLDPRQIVRLVRKGGEVLEGEEATRLLGRAARKPALLGDIEHVTLRNVAVQTEENVGHAVGPWDLDAMPERDMQPIRGFSMIASWAQATDVRLSNNQLIVAKDGGRRKLMYVFSDVGSSLEQNDPARLAPTVKIDPRGRRIHSDSNRIVSRAFDRATPADARFGVDRIAGLTVAQIEASVAAGVASYPLARFLTARLVARRNDMVKKMGLESVHGLLPEPSLARVVGAGRVTLGGPGGRTTTVELPEGGFQVIDGRLVSVP